MSDAQPYATRELHIVDGEGRPRIVLSAAAGVPAIRLLRDDGQAGATVTIDIAGHPSVSLTNPNPAGPTALLEIDDKGIHLKFDRPGGASSYLFLNNAGGSGVVLIDASGRRRLHVIVGADGSSTIQRFDDGGKPVA